MSLQPLHPDYKELVRAAMNQQLPRMLELAPGQRTHDLNWYTLGGLGAWAFGDEVEGLKRLELAYRAWKKPKLEPCKSCGVMMRFTLTAKGTPVPISPAGVSHFADCPDAKRFSKKGKKEAA